MIPKVIHYCWFGKNPKDDLILSCIKSWKEHCPSYEIKEWNEENFDVNSSDFTKKMYSEKKWAFVADYVRLNVLKNEGGIYLDTDMLLLKNLDPLLTHDCFLGEEEPGIISAGALGSIPGHPFIVSAKNYYDYHEGILKTIPIILTEIYNGLENKEGIKVYPSQTFYPFNMDKIKDYKGQKLSDDVYGIHLWNYSWGHPLNKFFKKIEIYSFGKKVVEFLGVKKILKRILGFV